ncbi:HNH endonuclease [Candidatus Woesearchaeota archaeon]|nr:HNH endonuclease [Candidatus Woesearchaeota archaeon]
MQMDLFGLGGERDSKRSLGQRDKQLLYLRAKEKCELCHKPIKYLEMEVGHNKAWTKGGRTTLKNCLCLCPTCNKLQGTDSKKQYLKKIGVKDKDEISKNKLENLSLSELKAIAKKKGIKVKGRASEGLFYSETSAPTKRQYINKLKGAVSGNEIKGTKKAKTTKIKKKRRRRSTNVFDLGW